MPRQERNPYQLPFEYPSSPWSLLSPREPSISRFVREVGQGATVSGPSVAAEHLQQRIYAPFASFTQEEMWLLLLNNKNRITHEAFIYRGTINSIFIRPAEIFRPAIGYNAAGLILSHCHPSGNPTPSPEDVRVTHDLVDLGKALDVPVLDHIVVGNNQWTSLRELGLGFASAK
jgi:DNA repair protein RadC